MKTVIQMTHILEQTIAMAKTVHSSRSTANWMKPISTAASWFHANIRLLLFWHAPLGVRTAIRRHQPPQRAVLSQVNYFIQREIVGSQISLDGVHSVILGYRWYRDALAVSSSSLVWEPLGSSWHLHRPPYVQCAQIWNNAMTGLSL